MIKTFTIVEDHFLFAQALENLLSSMGNYTCVEIITDGKFALEKLKLNEPDIIFLDLNLPNVNGIDLIIQLKKNSIKSKILVISMLIEPLVILKAKDAGADGYLPKNTNMQELENAIASIKNNEFYLPSNLVAEIQNLDIKHNQNWENSDAPSKINLLTEREKEVLKLIVKGFNNNDIAKLLFNSPLTIKTHRKNILKKLGLKNSVALANYAANLNL